MNKILFALLICFRLTAQAQDTTWTKSDNKIYGSKAEKLHQDLISHASDNRFLYELLVLNSSMTRVLVNTFNPMDIHLIMLSIKPGLILTY